MDDERYVLKALEIAEFEGTAKTHFLNPEAQRSNKSLGDLTGLSGIGFHLIEVQPGQQSTEYHVHHHEDECTYILSGSALVTVGEETHEVGAGDFIGYRAGGLAHTMLATGDEPLVCIVVGSRLKHDVGDYPRLGKRIYRQAGLPWNLVDHDAIVTPDAGAK
ncbi:cupin domain-containing protein [Granulosicoccus antarcticus]|uniref:Cupin type-2 domain-containing protein n=1 Tax=Granulosicoccus antarcticus IMCC3135 TaxID=1192854 RepID=A0A2Z2NLA8_9GAMM|nr:cupin domain-containing protein [Granulosicoccus antarcticus]ASJ71315.1 hypothetical protein IMCC3135_06015 [Granulosicoccus antarcticus IMCC3135]